MRGGWERVDLLLAAAAMPGLDHPTIHRLPSASSPRAPASRDDGSYLAEFLLAKGYRVVGIVRRSSTTPYERIEHLIDRVEIHSADLLDQTSLVDVMEAVKPDEVYNLAAQSLSPRRGRSRCSRASSPRSASPVCSRR
jgi:hypothetical protein